jgi:hypothetical protein
MGCSVAANRIGRYSSGPAAATAVRSAQREPRADPKKVGIARANPVPVGSQSLSTSRAIDCPRGRSAAPAPGSRTRHPRLLQAIGDDEDVCLSDPVTVRESPQLTRVLGAIGRPSVPRTCSDPAPPGTRASHRRAVGLDALQACTCTRLAPSPVLELWGAAPAPTALLSSRRSTTNLRSGRGVSLGSRG